MQNYSAYERFFPQLQILPPPPPRLLSLPPPPTLFRIDFLNPTTYETEIIGIVWSAFRLSAFKREPTLSLATGSHN